MREPSRGNPIRIALKSRKRPVTPRAPPVHPLYTPRTDGSPDCGAGKLEPGARSARKWQQGKPPVRKSGPVGAGRGTRGFETSCQGPSKALSPRGRRSVTRDRAPRIAGPRCGDPRVVWGALWCRIRAKGEGGAGGSQIAVPGGGPAMRGGLTAFVPRGGHISGTERTTELFLGGYSSIPVLSEICFFVNPTANALSTSRVTDPPVCATASLVFFQMPASRTASR